MRNQLETKIYGRNLIKEINALGCLPFKILEVDDGRTSTNGPEYKKTHEDA